MWVKDRNRRTRQRTKQHRQRGEKKVARIEANLRRLNNARTE